MSRLKPLLLNASERRTFEALQGPCASSGAMVAPKVRLGSIIELRSSGLSAELFDYGTRAEFDFVVASTQEPGLMPQFAVEFDGPIHAHDEDTIRRDRMKNKICRELGLPLLRIDAEYLDDHSGKSLVSVLAKVFFYEEAFTDAQANGQIPPWEPFCYWGVYEESDGGWESAFAVDASARQKMFDFASARGRWWVPETVTTPINNETGYTKSYCLFEIEGGQFIVGYASIRDFGFFAGVGAWELAEDLAVADCGEKLRMFEAGRYRPASLGVIAGIRDRTVGWMRQGMMSSDMPHNSPRSNSTSRA